jgi:uncharacterized damage-inducible protein DinB
VNDGLIDAFRHNAWAMREVIKVCKQLPEEQLHMTPSVTYGSIIATFWHTVTSEASYCARLMGEEPEWDRRTEQPPSLDVLMQYVDDLGARWARFLTQPFDAERTLVVTWKDGNDRDVPAAVFLVQALHHGNEHRTHICTVLSSIGMTTPDIGVWDYAEATNRARPKSNV